MTAHNSLAVFAALASELQHEPDEAVTGQVIVTRLHELVPEAERVSLTVRAPRQAHATLASTDLVAEEVDTLQHVLGQGPSLLVADAGDWLRSGEVETDDRWPGWGPQASARGVRSLLTVAIADRREPMGAITLYSGARDGFADRGGVDVTLAFAALAGTALSFARRATSLQTAIGSRHVIGMAQGIVMERYAIDQHRSFDLLRRLSSTSNTKLRDVAAQIVETGAVPQGAHGQEERADG